MPSPIDTAIEHLGSAVALSRALDVTPQAISNWRRSGAPIDRCAAIELVTAERVKVEQLRPDVAWQRDASGRVTGYTVPVAYPGSDAQARAA